MRQWRRAIVPSKCGRCGARIDVGAPLLQIVVVNLHAIKLRCPDCAEEAIPQVIEAAPNAPPLHTMRRCGLLPLDEREPGEEG